MKIVIFFYCLSILMLLVFGNLESKLKKWDVINYDDITTSVDLSMRKKRSSNTEKTFVNKVLWNVK